MLIKFDMDSDLYRQIEKLVSEGKYDDVYQFLKIAIRNQIHEESSESKSSLEEEPTGSIKEELTVTIGKRLQNLAKTLGDVSFEKSEIVPLPRPLIWSFYNRFFPIKVTMRSLAVIFEFDKKWMLLKDFQEKAFSFAESNSDKLKEYEENENLPRNLKISTGLPTPKSELRGLPRSQRDKKESKYIASKLRFQDQFIGRFIKKDHRFDGACFEMGLMGVKHENEKTYVTLTDLGRDFALEENPILDIDDFSRPFFEEEVSIIVNKIIPKFKLENIIVDIILEKLKAKDLMADDIDKIFIEEKTKYYKNFKSMSPKEQQKILSTITAERVATMGRLSELRLVKWKINKKGQSVYSLT